MVYAKAIRNQMILLCSERQDGTDNWATTPGGYERMSDETDAKKISTAPPWKT